MTHLLILWLACIRDFHETDKQQDELYQLWANRVGIHPSMPTLFLQQAEATRMKINTQLENVGLSTVGFNVEQVRDMLPDSSTGNLSFALRNYKCDGKAEHGECELYKWDVGGSHCDLSAFQTKSRGGWKDHLLIGRTIGVFLSQQLKFALDELYNDSFTTTTLRNLSHAYELDRKTYLSSSLHVVHEGNHVNKNTDFLGGLGRFSPFWKTNAYCRTVRTF
jgi:hypothetical protein